MSPRVLILRAPGTNCDEETAFAFERAGSVPRRVHVRRLLEEPRLAEEFQILCIPGGFSYGDDVAAGRILGNQIRHHLKDCLWRFRDAGKLILGVCNGFQVLIRSGLLLDEEDSAGDDRDSSAATLTWNDSGKFEDRWVELAVEGGRSIFLQGIQRMFLPVAHAEGKFVPRDAESLARLDSAGQLVLRYARRSEKGSGPICRDSPEGASHKLDLTPFRGPFRGDVLYPDNPNGSVADVAGVSDTTGRVLGLMPHPERHVDPTQHPRWTRRREQPAAGDGLAVFANAVAYFR